MTNKERLVALTILVSVLGFAFITAINPLQVLSSSKDSPSVVIDYKVYSFLPHEYKLNDFEVESRVQEEREHTRMVSMLSTVLEIPADDIEDVLKGGVRPAEMLASSGIYLSDLAEEFNFEIIGERGLVKFRV
jgi:hypothetical protein